MSTIFLYKGLPASGKSTAAKKAVDEAKGQCIRVNKDDLRAMLHNGAHSKGREALVIKMRDAMIMEAITNGQDVIVDDTNLHEKHETRIREIADDMSSMWSRRVRVQVVDHFLDVPVAECIARDANREKPVGKRVIMDMAARAGLLPKEPPKYHIPGLESVIICDIDGTVALLNCRNPFDASTCEQDLPNTPIIELVRGYMDRGTKVFFFSGRQDQYRNQTVRWLHKHGLGDYVQLVMRPTGDYRKDVIVKGEMFAAHIKGKYNVHFVLDDRQQVVDGWRELGLTCLQVAPGDF